MKMKSTFKTLIILFLSSLSIISCMSNDTLSRTQEFSGFQDLYTLLEIKGYKLEEQGKVEKEIDLVNKQLTGSSELEKLRLEWFEAEEGEKQYQLVSFSKYGEVRVSIPFKLNSNKEFIVSGTQCVCQGCTGCEPKRKSNGECYCVDCEKQDEESCTKTESDLFVISKTTGNY